MDHRNYFDLLDDDFSIVGHIYPIMNTCHKLCNVFEPLAPEVLSAPRPLVPRLAKKELTCLCNFELILSFLLHLILQNDSSISKRFGRHVHKEQSAPGSVSRS